MERILGIRSWFERYDLLYKHKERIEYKANDQDNHVAVDIILSINTIDMVDMRVTAMLHSRSVDTALTRSLKSGTPNTKRWEPR